MQRIRGIVFLVGLLGLASLPLFAQNGGDQVRFGQSITVHQGESVGDVVCFGCSVHVLGTANGDVVVFGGSVTVDGAVHGDATVFGGELRISPGASVDGDVVAFGGGVHRAPQATIGGEVTNFAGPIWLGAVFLPPIVVIILIGALIVWLVKPNPRPQPYYPPAGPPPPGPGPAAQ